MDTFKRLKGSAAAFSLVFALLGPNAALAATSPSLGAAATYGVLSDTYTNPLGPTTILGDVGFTTGPAVLPLGGHPSGTYPNYGVGGNYAAAGTAQATTLTALNSGVNLPCDVTFAPGAIDLSVSNPPAHVGTTYTPGVYCVDGAMSINTAPGITLSGAGTYIFRSTGAFSTSAGMTVTLASASACDVFWNPTGGTTIGANNTFAGTVIPTLGAGNDITVLSTTSWIGRALAFGHTVTTPNSNVSITVPTCAAAAVSGKQPSTINVVKTVVNDNGGTKTAADFALFVDGTPVASGITNTFPAITGVYHVTETNDPKYTRTFSGDCDANGGMNLIQGQNKFCIVTNNDIGAPVVVPPVPPHIDVVKVPSPLSLPNGPGAVTYTYTARNIGTVPMSDVTMVGDTCSPIILASGDVNNDKKLDVNETWVHTCSTTLTETHTNTVVATGWANGISATDIASATVVVGLPLVPPLIHVTKVPSRYTLLVGGGAVTYTEKITNPGTVPLSNVSLNDDKCAINFVSGDSNSDSKLDVNETWTYTCTVNLAATTTNVATATGEANGFTVRDFATATVVVAAAAPILPKSGMGPTEGILAARAIAAAAVLLVSVAYLLVMRKRQTI